MPKRYAGTLDLFKDYAPPPAVDRYDPERVRATNLPMLIARAIGETLSACGKPRCEVAHEISLYLGERVSEAMLDKYASVSSGQAIPAHRLIALVVATGDARLLNALAAEAGLVVVAAHYEALIRREMAKDARDRLDREIAASDAQWRASR